MNFKKYHVSRNLWDNRGFSATTITSNYSHNISNNYGTTLSTIEGDEVTITQSAYPTGNVGYQNGFFMIDVDFSKYAVGDVVTISFDYIVNEIHALSTQTATTVYAGKNSNTVPAALSSGDWKISGRLTAVITIIADMNPYVEVRLCGNSITVKNIMFNEGSTSLPYEPYSSEVWHDIPHYIHNTATDTITTLPAVLYPTGTTATVGLKGNTVQSGTPSPQNPIMPQECGERTGNLLPEFYAASGEFSGNSYTITKNSIETHNDGSVLGAYYVLAEFKRYGNYANYTPIDEKHSFKIPAGTYTFSGNENIYNRDNGLRLIVGQLGQAVSGASAGAINVGIGQTFTVNADSYVCPVLEIRYDSHVDEYILTNPMLNTGSTALPYEPYGYKIPISSASTTTPVYLGEVETTRRVKKLVLTGEETGWTKNTVTENNAYYRAISGYYRYNGLCSHYAIVDSVRAETGVFFGGAINFLTKLSDEIDTVDKWKSYLQQQYAAGTPVTIWYVLATDETAVVNEPLMKIGEYADEVSNISIPVTAGGDTISVGTTVQPSEVTVNYKGWHPVANVHERDNGAWT